MEPCQYLLSSLLASLELTDTRIDQKNGNLGTLIALELDDLAQFWIFNQSAIACEILFERLQEFPRVIFRGKTLKSGESLTTVTLLNSNVDVVGGLGGCFGTDCLIVTYVGEGIWENEGRAVER